MSTKEQEDSQDRDRKGPISSKEAILTQWDPPSEPLKIHTRDKDRDNKVDGEEIIWEEE